MSKLLSHNSLYHVKGNTSSVITGSGKTLAFGIPMIHTILEWKKGSDKPDGENSEATTEVESLYLAPVEKTEEDLEAEGEEEEGVGDQDSHEDASKDDDECGDDEEEDEDERLGCVQVIENAEFDFEAAAEDKAAGQNQPLLGLVLTPTRELAVQVKHHIDAVAKFTGK